MPARGRGTRPAPGRRRRGGARRPGVKIHLSTATPEQLDELDGIGPTLAERIVEYRDAARRLPVAQRARTRSRASARSGSPRCAKPSSREPGERRSASRWPASERLALSPAPPARVAAARLGSRSSAARPPRLARRGALGLRPARRRVRGAARLAALAGALVLAGAAAGDARLAALDAPRGRVRDGPFDGSGRSSPPGPRPSAFGSSVEVRWPAGRCAARGCSSGCRAGRRFRAASGSATSSRQRSHPPVSADSTDRGRRGLRLRRPPAPAAALPASCSSTRARATGGGAAALPRASSTRMRRRAEAAVAAGLPAAEAALARGMVLGQDEEIDEPTREDFRDVGPRSPARGERPERDAAGRARAAAAGAGAGSGPRARGVALLALVALYVPLAGAGPRSSAPASWAWPASRR